MTEPAIPEGRRVYAIGDIHGRLDLLETLMATVREDNARRGPAATTIVVLGDVIDRGPQSAQIVRRFQIYTRASHRFVVLLGNHEAMMVRALDGDVAALRAWLRFGGDETLKSWGVPDAALDDAFLPDLVQVANRFVTQADLDWLGDRPLSHRIGDYLFVHAGLRPGVPLAEQTPQDMLWIGPEFTDCDETHGCVVVHGHTIEEQGPVFRANRIGLDTGAYRTGRLTALGLEGARRWTLATGVSSQTAEQSMASV